MTFSTLASPGVSLQGGGGSGGGGTPGGSDTQIQYNSSGTFAGASGLTTNGTELTIASGTKTADAPVLNMSQTWNNGAVTFTGLKFNAATGSSAGSAAASLLMDLQLEGTSKYAFRKDGQLTINYPTSGVGVRVVGNGNGFVASSSGTDGTALNGYGLRLQSDNTIEWSASSSGLVGGSVILSRRAAANLRLGAADAAGSAIAVSSVATNQLTLASSHGLTSGAAVIITGTTAPSGTSLNTLYYARSISAAVIELYSTFDQATATSGTTGIVAVTTAGTSASIRLSTPFQRLSPQDFTGTDIPGQPLLINGSRGTGTGPGGSIIFQVAPAVTTGSVQNALATALTINANQTATFANFVQIPQRSGSGLAAIGTGTTVNSGLAIASDWVGLTIGQQGGLRCNGNSSNWIGRDAYFGWGNSSATHDSSDSDTRLFRDTTATLALRNGNEGQTFRLYGRFTDITNDFERFFINAPTTSGAAVLLGTQKGATTGAARALEFQTDGTTRLTIAATTNTITLPTSSTLNCGDASVVRLRYINSPNNVITFFDFYDTSGYATFANGATNPRINFGGTDATCPALKRSSTTLIVRLANDTANAPLESASLKTDAPAGGTAATWKLGTVASVSPTSPNRTIEVDIGGTIYYLHAKTTND